MTKWFSMFIFESKPADPNRLSHWWIFSGVALVVLMTWFSEYRLSSLPTALYINHPSASSETFIADRAWQDLVSWMSIGRRPVGSKANEIFTVDFLKNAVELIQRSAHSNHLIEIDTQTVSGAYHNGRSDHRVYRNIQNVVVRFQSFSELPSNDSLLVNCHFDSAVGSPGASDDAANCVIMLEILRVLSLREETFQHPIVFLFNGAEEVGLYGSRGFMHHPWQKNVRAFINLESAGSNGKEMLFQVTAKDGWLIEMYQKAVPYPNGQVIAEELFQNNFIPSDTDFSVFKKNGLPGMDLAHFMNGYRYHTEYDHISYLSPNMLQRTGTNVLELVRMIANTEYLTDVKNHRTEPMVYYDVLGFFFVAYTENTGHIMNIVIGIASTAVPFILLDAQGKIYGVFNGILATVASFCISGILCLVLGFELNHNDTGMSWFTRTYIAFLLYGFIAIAAQAFFYARVIQFRCKSWQMNATSKTQARIIGVNVVWTCVIFYLKMKGSRCGYIIMVPQLIILIVSVLASILRIQRKTKWWVFVYLIGQCLIVLWTSHFYHLMIAVFVPVQLRTYPYAYPDQLIGLAICVLTFLMTSFSMPLVGVLRRSTLFLIVVLFIPITMRIVLIFTGIDFPYDANPSYPTPQRHYITHAVRQIYDKGEVSYSDYGFWMLIKDVNARRTLREVTAPNHLKIRNYIEKVRELPFGGRPAYAYSQLGQNGYWLDAETHPLLPGEARLKFVDKVKMPHTHTNKVLLKFEVTETVSAPEPYVGGAHRNHIDWFISVIHGRKSEPFKFSLLFRIYDRNYKAPLVDITLVTVHWNFTMNHEFAQLLDKMPDWTSTTPSVAALSSWQF